MSKKTQKQSIDKNSIIRIVAVALVVVLIVSVAVVAFVRNAPKKYVDEDGNEHLLYIEEGNTVLNDDGRIVVYATDVNGDKVKDENGEPMTNVIDFPQLVVKENVLETPYYKMTMPEEWKLQKNGVYVYKENEDVTFEIEQLGEHDGDILSYMKSRSEADNAIINGIKANFPATTSIEEDRVITLKEIISRRVEIKVAKSEKDVYLCTNTVYFVFDNIIYKAALIYSENSYDTIQEKIDLVALLNTGLAMKDKVVD